MSYHYPRHNLMSDSNIFIASKLGDSELLKDLLAAGHKINHRDKYGKSALHHAVEGKLNNKGLTICRPEMVDDPGSRFTVV